MRNFVISAALIAAATIAAPVSAQNYRYQGGQIEREVNQIENRIQRAAQRGQLSRREANQLLRQADQIDRLADRYARNGIDRRVYADLQNRLNKLRNNVRWEAHDRNDRRGRG